jgi:hypothetical protein
MYLQIDMLDAQLNKRPDGSVEILGQSGYIHVHAKSDYAKKVKDAYEKLQASYPKVDSLKITINIELPLPIGIQVNEGK